MTNHKWLKRIVPLCILIVVVGIWIFKNGGIGPEAPPAPAPDGTLALEATDIDLAALGAYGLPILIDFGSESCAPCREMAPVLEAMHAEMQGKAVIQYVDVWKYPRADDGFPVQVIPTQVFFYADGTPYVPSETIPLEFTLYSYKDTGAHAFTAHQGGLTEEDMRLILSDMGVDE